MGFAVPAVSPFVCTLIQAGIVTPTFQGRSATDGTRRHPQNNGRFLDEFYCPSMHAEVKRYVKSRDICQMTAPKGRVSVAALANMACIDTSAEQQST